MDMIGWGNSWLAQQLDANASMTATLTRTTTGQTATVNVTTQGDAGFDREYAVELGNTIQVFPPEEGYCGFVMLASEYDFGAGPVIPEKGDTLTINGVVYSLTAPASLLPWRYADPPYKQQLWLHTKQKPNG